MDSINKDPLCRRANVCYICRGPKSSCWPGALVWRGGCQARRRPCHLTVAQNYKVPNSPRAIEFWAFHLRSAPLNPHRPVHWKHVRYPLSPSME
ncbi:hypothetical protein TNCV_375761 [Trichonephila clavipes]|nr:hypothetical protein TNCV_375761 [Trichonephila clavipes]